MVCGDALAAAALLPTNIQSHVLLHQFVDFRSIVFAIHVEQRNHTEKKRDPAFGTHIHVSELNRDYVPLS